MRLVFKLLILTVFIVSCDENRVFDKYEHIDNASWDKDSIVNFSFNLKDTLSRNQVFIKLRNTVDYSYSNIYLFTRVNFPDGKVLVDTLEYEMTTAEGNWLGDGISSVKSNILYFKKDVVFYSKGDYSVSIQHGMRDEKLIGIKDVGLRIENN